MRAALLIILSAIAARAESTPHEALLVLSKGDHTLAIVDPSTLKVVAKAPVGEDPHEVIASADGKLAYVSNYGGGAYHTLTVIDLIAQKQRTVIDLGALTGPHGLFFAGGKTWFTAEGAKALGRYDPASNQIDLILGTGQDRTHMIWVSDNLERICTTNISSATVSLFEKSAARPPGPPPPGPAGSGPPPPRRGPPAGDWEQTLIPVGKGAEGFDLNPNHTELWTADAQDGTISIIDLQGKRVTDTLQAHVQGANRLKFTPDGKYVFIASLNGSGIIILDAKTKQEIKRLPARGAAGIEMQPDGSRAYVAHTPENYVAVIDLKTLAEVGRIDAGPGPDGLAWSVQR